MHADARSSDPETRRGARARIERCAATCGCNSGNKLSSSLQSAARQALRCAAESSPKLPLRESPVHSRSIRSVYDYIESSRPLGENCERFSGRPRGEVVGGPLSGVACLKAAIRT